MLIAEKYNNLPRNSSYSDSSITCLIKMAGEMDSEFNGIHLMPLIKNNVYQCQVTCGQQSSFFNIIILY